MLQKSPPLALDTLVKRIRQAKCDDLPSLYDLKRPLDQVLWVLTTVRYGLESTRYFSCGELVAILKALDIAAREKIIKNALARAGSKIDKIGTGKMANYKVAFSGRTHIAQQKSVDTIRLLYLDGTKPRSDRRLLLEELGPKLRGDILILDKYLGAESLDLLEKLAPTQSVKMLSAKVTGNEERFRRELGRFLREFPKFQFRLYPHPSHLHDRYMLTHRDLFILGHGIKDLATKESFVVVLRDAVGKEIREALRDRFKERWRRSKPLP